MGFKFRKSFKIAPGVRVNFGKKSSSISFGTKGFRTSFNTKGRNTTSFGIPGTGLSYSTSTSLMGSSKSKKKRKVAQSKVVRKKQVKNSAATLHTATNANYSRQTVKPQYSAKTYKVCGIIAMVLAVPVVLLSLLLVLVDPVCLIFTAIGIALFVAGLFMKKASKVAQQEEPENNTADNMKYIICESCNSSLEEDACFCPHCGSVVNPNK